MGLASMGSTSGLGRGGHPLRHAEFRATLRDGTPVVVRALTPADRDRLREGFRRLSPRSRYRRFLSPVPELSDEQLRNLTELDYVNHFAWAAVRADRPEEGLGVARFVRLKELPDVAEASVTVVDEHHGKGLGTLLVGLLALAARAVGITTFRAYVLQDNVEMRELLAQLGAHAERESPGVLRMDVPLDPKALPESPAARLLRAVAAEVVGPIAGPFTLPSQLGEAAEAREVQESS